MKDNRKIAAITAAIDAYLEEEATTARNLRQPASPINLWRASGRQEIMQMSQLWQRRIVPLR